MSWFNKKKVPRVPFPEAHPAGALRFPSMKPEERIIEPSRVKEAVGLETPSITEETPSLPSLPSFEEPATERFEERRTMSSSQAIPPQRPMMRTTMPPAYSKQESEPLFVKIDVYQRILGEIDSIRKDVSDAFEASKHLETSEYNEEENYAKLKRGIRVIHDRLLQVDKTLFKAQGD
ncbi:hypothetical protein HYT55_03075 [Candidatus Woesearchaeota archaeon]|nr:hypothetical protein [Candidatus Woesearchaeota archaeon]